MKVLEVGCGHLEGFPSRGPAIENPGHILARDGVDYVGVDLPGGFMRYGIGLREDGTPHSGDGPVHGLAQRFKAVEANVAALPFPDEAFDLVMLRSVFGEFRGWDWGSDRRDFNPMDLYGAGMSEINRVLVPLGRLVIAEENYEEDVELVKRYLGSVGLEVTEFAQMKNHGDYEKRDGTHWYDLRSRYYGKSDEMLCTGAHGEGGTLPYVLVAAKPVQH